MATPPITTFPARGRAATFIVSEANGYRSREQGVVAGGSGVLTNGTIMRLNAGKYVPWTPATTAAVGALYQDVDATAVGVDVQATFLVRDCEFQRAMLKFTGAPTTGEKDGAYADLAAKGIAFR